MSIVLFTVSLSQSCYCTVFNECNSSLAALMMGWLAMYMGGPTLTWLANPLLLASWVLCGRFPILSFIFSLAAALISASFLLFTQVYNSTAEIMDSINYYKPGYWLWLASNCYMCLGNAAVLFEIRNNKHFF